jgi:hypothetical protein
MMTPTRCAALVGLLLLAAVASTVALCSLRYTGESAHAKYARIQMGMSPEEVAEILADCTWQGAMTGEQVMTYWKAPDGMFIMVSYEGVIDDPKWPLKVCYKSVSDVCGLP